MSPLRPPPGLPSLAGEQGWPPEPPSLAGEQGWAPRAPIPCRGVGLGPQHILALPESAEPRTVFGYFLHVPLPFEGLGLLHLSPRVGAVNGSRPGSWPRRLP